MDRELMKFLSNREPQVTTDIDVITAAVAVPLLEVDGEDHIVFTVRSHQLAKLVFPVGTVKVPIRPVLMLLLESARKNLV